MYWNTCLCTGTHACVLEHMHNYLSPPSATYKGVEAIEGELKDGEAELGERVHDEAVVVPLHRLHVQHKMLHTQDEETALSTYVSSTHITCKHMYQVHISPVNICIKYTYHL